MAIRSRVMYKQSSKHFTKARSKIAKRGSHYLNLSHKAKNIYILWNFSRVHSHLTPLEWLHDLVLLIRELQQPVGTLPPNYMTCVFSWEHQKGKKVGASNEWSTIRIRPLYPEKVCSHFDYFNQSYMPSLNLKITGWKAILTSRDWPIISVQLLQNSSLDWT